ncbi:MAG: DUF5681 domain-containing protein [Parvibaculum sp.]|nr:DUF5681 domain-containing protein [Parvibaculum sp.]
MSVRRAEARKLDTENNADDEAVGYGKPPAATRFKPGQSGNPNGRPKKKAVATGVPHMSEERMKDIVQEEAYRTISVRDGEKLVEIPVVQAILRGVALSAAKGNAKAQKTFTDLLRVVEEDKKALHDEYIKTMIEYKIDGMKEIERCKKLGIPAPEMIPHPDDIIIDMNTGRAEVRGPMTPEDKKIWDELRKRKKSFKKSIAALEALLAKDPKNKAIADSIASERRILRMITKAIPD